MNRKLLPGIAAATLAVAFGGTAMAALPGGQQSGTSPQSSGALVTLAIPQIVGVNVAHNFVLDFNSATKCWGTGSTQGTFPQAASGTTTYNFAVDTTSHADDTTPVVCPSAGALPAVATVQVFSNVPGATGHLQAGIQDGGHGGGSTTFTGLISDIFSAGRLKLTKIAGSCGGGTAGSPHTMTVAASDIVTVIPPTGWSDCTQTLSLTLDSTTLVTAGTATGTLTFTMIHP